MVPPFVSQDSSFDITDRKKAEIRREALVRLTDNIRDLDNPKDLTFAASTILGETLHVSRASYGTIDPDAETLPSTGIGLHPAWSRWPAP